MIDKYWKQCSLYLNGHLVTTRPGPVHETEGAVLAALPDRKLTITQAISNGDTIAVEGTLSYTGPGTGNEEKIFWSSFWTFADGIIVEDHTYCDSAAMADFPDHVKPAADFKERPAQDQA